MPRPPQWVARLPRSAGERGWCLGARCSWLPPCRELRRALGLDAVRQTLRPRTHVAHEQEHLGPDVSSLEGARGGGGLGRCRGRAGADDGGAHDCTGSTAQASVRIAARSSSPESTASASGSTVSFSLASSASRLTRAARASVALGTFVIFLVGVSSSSNRTARFVVIVILVR